VLAEIRKHLAVFPVIAPKPTTFPDVLASLGRLRWLGGPQIYDLLLAHTGRNALKLAGFHQSISTHGE
jgi:hypothetical protein